MEIELIADFEKDFLFDILKMLDRRIKEIEKKIDPHSNEESIYFAPIEHLKGVGFVTCQRYIASICNLFIVNKTHSIKQGPQKNQVPIAEIVNATANYWKHIEDGETDLHKNTKKILETINIEIEKSYCVTNVLYQCGYEQLSDLFNDLIKWRDSLLEDLLKQREI